MLTRRAFVASTIVVVFAPRTASGQTNATPVASPVANDTGWDIGPGDIRPTPTGAFRWVSQITNTGSVTRDVPVVGLRFFDAAGTQITDAYARPIPPVLGPGESGFLEGTEIMEGTVERVETTFCETTHPEEYTQINDRLSLEVVASEPAEIPVGLYGSVTVTNTGETVAEDIGICILLRDANGSAIGADERWFPRSIPPGEVLGTGWELPFEWFLPPGTAFADITQDVWVGYNPTMRAILCE